MNWLSLNLKVKVTVEVDVGSKYQLIDWNIII